MGEGEEGHERGLKRGKGEVVKMNLGKKGLGDDANGKNSVKFRGEKGSLAFARKRGVCFWVVIERFGLRSQAFNGWQCVEGNVQGAEAGLITIIVVGRSHHNLFSFGPHKDLGFLTMHSQNESEGT